MPNMIVIKPKEVVRQYKNTIDCKPLEEIMAQIKLSPTSDRLNKLKNVLNSLFKDAYCESIIFTKNTDKLFFGMCIMPIIKPIDMDEIIIDNEPSKVDKKYMLEFDSKLFEIGLKTRELVAILLHELGHIILDLDKAIDEVMTSLTFYLQKNRETLDLEKYAKFKQILIFGFKDALRKINSIFADQETNADSYAVALGYGPDLESALKKISDRCTLLNRDIKNKLLVFQWTLRLYKNVRLRRIPAIKTLERTYQMTGSELEKREINTCLNKLKRYEDGELVDESYILYEKNNFSIFRKFKYKGMRGIEDDLYEYTLRVKSVDQQDEALMILREINTRLAVLDDYINTGNLDENERERWIGVRKRYMMLREELSKKTTYDDKYYGLFVKTPVIKSRYEF